MPFACFSESNGAGAGYSLVEKGTDGNGPDSAPFTVRSLKFNELWRESERYAKTLHAPDKGRDAEPGAVEGAGESAAEGEDGTMQAKNRPVVPVPVT